MPSLKILKRPTSGSSSPGSATAEDKAAKAAMQAKNLRDRERAYQEARKKIFGGEEGASPSDAVPLQPSSSPRPASTAEVSESDDALSSSTAPRKGKRTGELQRSAQKSGSIKPKNHSSSLSPSSPLVAASASDTDPLASSTGSLELPRPLINSRSSSRPATPASAQPSTGQKIVREPRGPPSSKATNGQPVRGFGRSEEQEAIDARDGKPAPAATPTEPATAGGKKKKGKGKKAAADTDKDLPDVSALAVSEVAAAQLKEQERQNKKALSAAAQAFVPKGLVPARVADRSGASTPDRGSQALE